MSDTEWENQGTGLGDVFDILAKTPSERLISLTIQLGESPEDIIVVAMSLLILQREEQALKKLQMLRDNPLANHLSEKCHTSGGKLDGFGNHCGQFQTHTMESLSLLARVFKVLSEQRLCEPLMRNLAYRRAISSDCTTRNCSHLEYFLEEAKVVCGPQLVEEMCSTAELPDGENTSLKAFISQDESSSVPRLPSTLQESPSEVSYPTHLEISIPPTVSFQEDKRAAAKPNSTPDICTETNLAPGQAQSPALLNTPTERSLLGAESSSTTDETLKSMSSSSQSNVVQNERPVQPNESSTETKITLPCAKSTISPKISVPKSLYDTEEEEDEEIFYAFVILHAPADAEQAEDIKEKLEKAISGEGATFSEEFAVPGKSTLKCVEDAVNNSAFTFLLLTRNFNTKMLEMKTNIALINSINKTHKFNTVIPLLPENNCVPRPDIPIVLQTLVPLEEKKNFEKKLQKALTPARIKKQRSIWTEEQRVRRLNRLSLQEVDRRCMEQQRLLSSREGGDGRALWPPQANIHIENANYVMIGNDSTMTVGGSLSNDG
uniref:Toll-like receptor adaptor molecule 1 n=2 Tax=Nothobranchius kadleci TaxID=1051664 RepID=A0A1A8CKX1_NOTKA